MSNICGLIWVTFVGYNNDNNNNNDNDNDNNNKWLIRVTFLGQFETNFKQFE